MSKFILLSDLHLMRETPVARTDDIVATQFRKLEFVLDYAIANSCVVLQAGDFVNRPRSWDLLPKIVGLLKDKQVPIFACFGQHDMYMYSTKTNSKTTLGVLEKTGLVSILGADPISIGCVDIYGASWGEGTPTPKSIDRKNILVMHRSVGVSALYPGHEYVDAKKFLKENGSYDIIVVGDIHRKFFVSDGGRHIVNTGPLSRTTAEQYSWAHKPGFFVYDPYNSAVVSWVDIPCAEANCVLSREHVTKAKNSLRLLDEFVTVAKQGGSLVGSNLYDIIQGLIQTTGSDKGDNSLVRDILTDVMGDSDE